MHWSPPHVAAAAPQVCQSRWSFLPRLHSRIGGREENIGVRGRSAGGDGDGSLMHYTLVCPPCTGRSEKKNPYLVLTTHAKFHGPDQTGYDPYPEAILVWDVICLPRGRHG